MPDQDVPKSNRSEFTPEKGQEKSSYGSKKTIINHNLIRKTSDWFLSTNQLNSEIEKTALDTGYKSLNQILHNAGWPAFGCIELGLSQHGIGELRLLAPSIRVLLKQHHANQLILINPPYWPYARALTKEKIDPEKVLIVKTKSIQDTLWASEQALQSGACAAVISWINGHDLSHKESRRLQLAAKSRQIWHILFRTSISIQQASAASLKMQIETNRFGQLQLNILKQPNGWGGQQCTVSLHPHYENWQRIPAELLPVANRRRITILPTKLPEFNNSHHQQAKVTVLTPLSSMQSVH